MANESIPTAEIIYALQWLGTQKPDGTEIPVGSGVVIRHESGDYLATALHVASDCKFKPFVRRHKKWVRVNWQFVGFDKDTDVAVLKTSDGNLLPAHLTPTYGSAGTLVGETGRAMGFPVLADRKVTTHIAEHGGFPIAIATVITSYWSMSEEHPKINYLGGLVNAGFSGGAIAMPISGGRLTISGIITEKEGVLRNVYERDPSTDEYEKDEKRLYLEPSGLIKYTDISVAIDLIERNS